MFSYSPVNCRVYLKTKIVKPRYTDQYGEILPGLYDGSIQDGNVFLIAPVTEWPVYLADSEFELYPGV